MPPYAPSTFGLAFSSLAPLGAYVERAGLAGDVRSETGPALSRFLDGVNTGSSAVFRHLGADIRSSLDSLDANVRLGGLRRFQLALQCEGPESEVAWEIARDLGEPDRVELRDELEKESARLREILKRHDKGLFGKISVRIPFFRDDDIVSFSRQGNFQALQRAAEKGLLEKVLEPASSSGPLLYPDMTAWFAISEFFAREPTSSHTFDKVVRKDVRLVVDAFFMSALKLHRGKDLLRLHRLLVANDPHTHESRWSLARLQQWTEIWVQALRRFDRRIDYGEGLETAKYHTPEIFTDAAVAGLTEIAEERFGGEPSSKSNATARFETMSTARMILNALNPRRPVERPRPTTIPARREAAVTRPPLRTTTPPIVSTPPPPLPPPPLTVSLISPGPKADPARLAEHPMFLAIGKMAETVIPLQLAEDQELVISADASDPASAVLRLKYHGGLFQVVDASDGVHLEEGSTQRPLNKKDWINFGARLSIAGHIVHVVKPARLH